MVDVFATAVAADVGDAALVVVAGGDAGVAVAARVLLACLHELGEVRVFAFGWRRHALIVIGLVGGELVGVGRVCWIIVRRAAVAVLPKVVHVWTCL